MPFIPEKLVNTTTLYPYSMVLSESSMILSLKMPPSSNYPNIPLLWPKPLSKSNYPTLLPQLLLCSPKWPHLKLICSLTKPPLTELELYFKNVLMLAKPPLMNIMPKKKLLKITLIPSETILNNPSEISETVLLDLPIMLKKWPNVFLKNKLSSNLLQKKLPETQTS